MFQQINDASPPVGKTASVVESIDWKTKIVKK